MLPHAPQPRAARIAAANHSPLQCVSARARRVAVQRDPPHISHITVRGVPPVLPVSPSADGRHIRAFLPYPPRITAHRTETNVYSARPHAVVPPALFINGLVGEASFRVCGSGCLRPAFSSRGRKLLMGSSSSVSLHSKWHGFRCNSGVSHPATARPPASPCRRAHQKLAAMGIQCVSPPPLSSRTYWRNSNLPASTPYRPTRPQFSRPPRANGLFHVARTECVPMYHTPARPDRGRDVSNVNSPSDGSGALLSGRASHLKASSPVPQAPRLRFGSCRSLAPPLLLPACRQPAAKTAAAVHSATP